MRLIVLATWPPLVMSSVLNELALPNRRSALCVQNEPVPVTMTWLLDEPELNPTRVTLFATWPPLVMINLLNAPELPTKSTPLLVHSELGPATMARLLLDPPF